MKNFLHYSSAVVGGVLVAFVGNAYGAIGYAFGIISVIYIACAQWTEGRVYK